MWSIKAIDRRWLPTSKNHWADQKAHKIHFRIMTFKNYMFSVLVCLLGLESTGITSFRLLSRTRRIKSWFDLKKWKCKFLQIPGRRLTLYTECLIWQGSWPTQDTGIANAATWILCSVEWSQRASHSYWISNGKFYQISDVKSWAGYDKKKHLVSLSVDVAQRILQDTN